MLTFPGFLPGIIFVTQVFIWLGSVAWSSRRLSRNPQGYSRKPQGHTLKGIALPLPPPAISSSDIHVSRISKPSPLPSSTHTGLHHGEPCGLGAKTADANWTVSASSPNLELPHTLSDSHLPLLLINQGGLFGNQARSEMPFPLKKP